VKIEGLVKTLGGTLAPDSKAKSQPAAAPATAGTASKVDLSPLSSSLGKAEAAIASTPVIDQARVDEIRQAISEGRFKVDASRIADGLINSVREMLDSQTSRS
jgi:negative regulator of flagellin synthesis FlgM